MSEKIKNILTVLLAAVCVFGLLIWSLLDEDETVSLSERRKLAQFSPPTVQTVLSGQFMERFESYAQDQFPLRDGFRSLKAVTAMYAFGQRDNNGLYIVDGQLAKLEYPLDESAVDYAAERFEYIRSTYLDGTGSRAWLSVIPDKNYFLADDNGYPHLDYDALISRLHEKTPGLEYIDLFSQLTIDDYYRTDAHWRQERLVPAAEYLAAAMGVTLPETEYTQNALDAPFYGVYYGQAALPVEPDTLYYLTSGTLDGCRVYDYEAGEYTGIYDFDAAREDGYELFLSGSRSLLTIENPAAEGGRELILFRDSFGSSIAPLLAAGYAKITLVDIRYLPSAGLGRLIDFHGQDVLFLYSASVINNSVTLK